MKRTPLIIRRKSFLNAGVSESLLNVLNQRNEYFRERRDKAFFSHPEALLVFIASELSELFPFRNVDHFINSLAKNYANLYGLLGQNPKQFLIIEKRTEEILPDLAIEDYIVFPMLVDSLKVFTLGQSRHDVSAKSRKNLWPD